MYLVSRILSSLIINIGCIYIGSEKLNKKIKVKNIQLLLSIFVGTLILLLINIYFDSIFKIIMNYLLVACIYRVLFKEEMSKVLVLSLITVIYYFVAEILFSIPLTIFLNVFLVDGDKNYWILLIANICITAIVLFLNRVKMFDNAVKKIMTTYSFAGSQELILAILFAISIFCRKNFDFVNLTFNYVANLFLIVIFFIILYRLYIEKRISIAISEKYDHLLVYIQKYELELTQKSMRIHEFKNQIISIKGFVSKKNKALNEYLESIMCDLKDMENNILTNMEYLPKGGLKGLIYFKLGDLKEKGISITTRVDSKIKRSSISKCSPALYNDILKMIGIYLDNAIESASVSPKKEIVLEVYCNKRETHFVITNTRTGKIDETKIDNVGYSTKGKNRGYGLQLAKKILEKHDELKQTREISEEYYTVHLVITC